MSYNPNAFGTPAAARSGSRLTPNISGAFIFRGTPVKETLSGSMALINPSLESDVKSIIGITAGDVPNLSEGEVTNTGLLLGIATSAASGDSVWISKTGFLTNTGPEIGSGGFVAGDFVVRLGVIVQNPDIPSQKDLLVSIEIMGQL